MIHYEFCISNTTLPCNILKNSCFQQGCVFSTLKKKHFLTGFPKATFVILYVGYPTLMFCSVAVVKEGNDNRFVCNFVSSLLIVHGNSILL